jgi:hypothetical protein
MTIANKKSINNDKLSKSFFLEVLTQIWCPSVFTHVPRSNADICGEFAI